MEIIETKTVERKPYGNFIDHFTYFIGQKVVAMVTKIVKTRTKT